MITRFWKYEISDGRLFAVCPDCQGKMPILRSWDSNPYHKCPYCTTMRELHEGRFKRWKEEAYGKDRD